MIEWKLILADGTRINGGEAGFTGEELWIYLPGWTVTKAAQVFGSQSKTKEIRVQYNEAEDLYLGYTECKNIMAQSKRIAVCLVKG